MSTQPRHAYLIIAHHNFDQLNLLISELDDERNDIYLHVDKKVDDFYPEQFKTKHSKLIVLDRMNVTWAGQSLIESEINLLKAASKNHYAYYHLISGDDLPLKIQDDIHRFFVKNKGKNFISIDEKNNKDEQFLKRISYYYWFQDYIGKNRTKGNPIYKAERYSLKFQKRMNLQRKEIIPTYKGSNWFSITDDLVQYILKHENLIKKQFYHGYAADELFIQSLAMDSPYRETIVNDSLRSIDWKRGKPYVYRKEDVPVLLSSGALFARKFDINVDKSAIDDVIAYLKKGKQEE